MIQNRVSQIGVKPTHASSRPISVCEYTDIIRMLLKRSEVNPGAGENIEIRVASMNGHTDIVKLILARSEINPAAKDNYAI